MSEKKKDEKKKKLLIIIVLSVLNSMKVGLTIFMAALIISSGITMFLGALGAVIDTKFLLDMMVLSGISGLVAFLVISPFCYMNGKKGKEYPFVKFNLNDLFGVLSRALFEGF